MPFGRRPRGGALEGIGIEHREDRTRPGAGGDGVAEKTEENLSTCEWFWLRACPGVSTTRRSA